MSSARRIRVFFNRQSSPAAAADDGRKVRVRRLPPAAVHVAEEETVLPRPEQAVFSSLVMQAAAGKGSGGRHREQTKWDGIVGKEKMKRAVDDAKDRRSKELGTLSSSELRKVARLHSVPETTFLRRMESSDPYATPVVGRPHVTTPESNSRVAHAIARADELQQGMTVSAILDTMEDLHPNLTRPQLKNVWQHNIKGNPILTRSVAGDKTTNKRANAITEVSQRHWFNVVGLVREELSKKSSEPGVDADGNRIMYDQVREHFVVGGDEECVLLNAGGKRIVGKKTLKKHMVKAGDSRKSATAFRHGSAAGVKGPTVYILPGDTAAGAKKSAVLNEFVAKQGSPPGSFVLHNPAAYMTDELWDSNIEKIAQGIRAMDPLIEFNPHWWVEYHLDGFGSHVNTLVGQRILASYKIAVVQSESHSSHVGQSFDNEPARDSKGGQRTAYVLTLQLPLPLATRLAEADVLHVHFFSQASLHKECGYEIKRRGQAVGCYARG